MKVKFYLWNNLIKEKKYNSLVGFIYQEERKR